MTITKRWIAGLVKACERVKAWACDLWRRVTTEAGYADALAVVSASAVALLCRNVRVVRFFDATAQALATLARTLIGERTGRSMWGGEMRLGGGSLYDSEWGPEEEWA